MARTGLKIAGVIVILAGLMLVATAGALYWLFTKAPAIEDKSVLVVKLCGEVPECGTDMLRGGPFGKAPVSMWDIRDVLQKAAADSRIAAVWIWIDYPVIGWAKAEEISEYLDEFRKSKKPAVAYLNAADERSYMIALSCDSIFAPAEAFVEMNGLATQVTHLPGLLEKLGIKVQFERFGKYKSVSGEKYGRKELTEPVREMINSLLDGEFDVLLSRICDRRRMQRDRLIEFLDQGNFWARYSIAAGLVDADKDEIAVEDYLKQKLGVEEKLNIVQAESYREVPREDVGLGGGANRIAVVYSAGMVMQGGGGFNPVFWETEQGSDPVVKALQKCVDDESTKAIVFRVDSPGGGGFGPEIICNKIVEVQKKKPVVASMSDYAASGGYWISMPARKIVAQPSTITGSIGVWGIFPDFTGFNEKLGLTIDVLKRGSRADMLLANRPLDEGERELFRKGILDMYNSFVDGAARFRKMPREKMEEIAQGRSWLGRQAKDNGLVDALGGLDVAIDVAKKEAGIEGPVDLWLPGAKSWYENLAEKFSLAGRETSLAAIGEEVQELERRINAVRIYAADPQRIEIR
ncbi:MAG: signal peptide peptidase SppA [Acidobacteriota bacterium]